MKNNFVSIPRSTFAKFTGIIRARNGPERPPGATSESFKTFLKMDAACDRYRANDQALTANSIWSWALSTEKVAYMPKDINISKSFEETEDQELKDLSQY